MPAPVVYCVLFIVDGRFELAHICWSHTYTRVCDVTCVLHLQTTWSLSCTEAFLWAFTVFNQKTMTSLTASLMSEPYHQQIGSLSVVTVYKEKMNQRKRTLKKDEQRDKHHFSTIQLQLLNHWTLGSVPSFVWRFMFCSQANSMLIHRLYVLTVKHYMRYLLYEVFVTFVIMWDKSDVWKSPIFSSLIWSAFLDYSLNKGQNWCFLQILLLQSRFTFVHYCFVRDRIARVQFYRADDSLSSTHDGLFPKRNEIHKIIYFMMNCLSLCQSFPFGQILWWHTKRPTLWL